MFGDLVVGFEALTPGAVAWICQVVLSSLVLVKKRRRNWDDAHHLCKAPMTTAAVECLSTVPPKSFYLQHSELSNLRFNSGPQNLLQSSSPPGLGDLGWPYLMQVGLLGWGTE